MIILSLKNFIMATIIIIIVSLYAAKLSYYYYYIAICNAIVGNYN